MQIVECTVCTVNLRLNIDIDIDNVESNYK